MNRGKFKYTVIALLVIGAMYLANRSQINSPGRAFPLEIYYQTGDMLIDEFGFNIPVKEFEITSTTEKVELVESNKWRLHGQHLINGSPAIWKAYIEFEPGAPEAHLLNLESNGHKIFPNEIDSTFTFDADEELKLRTK